MACFYAGCAADGKPSYVFEVEEGIVDQGACISDISFYPHEKEKLYGALCFMQVVLVADGVAAVVDFAFLICNIFLFIIT